MLRLVKRLLAVIGALTIIFVIILIITVYIASKPKPIGENTVLEMTLNDNIAEYVPPDPFSEILHDKKVGLKDLLESVANASADHRIKSIFIKLGSFRLGMGKIQELRHAIVQFRKSGKPAYIFSESYGEFGPGNGAYYLASAFDKIYLQPSGDVGLTGLMFETHFFKGTLDKLGVIPQLDHRKEFKTAMNSYTQTEYTKPHKEALLRVMNSLFEQIVDGISKQRDIQKDKVRQFFDQGPFSANQALENHLVDGLLYQDELYDLIKKNTGESTQFLSLEEYHSRYEKPQSMKDTIALIYGVGMIHRGQSEYTPLGREMTMGSATICDAFEKAIADKTVKAIIFRLDSPGGSYIASDTIWRQTIRAKQAGKPVIATMSDVAGSGGYFVAMAADKIVANPGTITGSIGVFAGKVVTEPLLNKLGITSDEVHTSDNSTMWSTSTKYTPQQWSMLEKNLDRIYNDFTSKAAQGRHLPLEKILQIAKGRIWTGQDALSNGLVDELGGFDTAVTLAKNAAGIAPDKSVNIKIFPKEKKWYEALLENKAISDTQLSSGEIKYILEKLEPVGKLLLQIGESQDKKTLSMPLVDTRDL